MMMKKVKKIMMIMKMKKIMKVIMIIVKMKMTKIVIVTMMMMNQKSHYLLIQRVGSSTLFQSHQTLIFHMIKCKYIKNMNMNKLQIESNIKARTIVNTFLKNYLLILNIL